MGPDDAIARLADGHSRFLSHLRPDRGPARPANRPPHQHRSTGPATGPWVTMVAWPDVRYPVQTLFDLALGDAFVVPTAPGTIAPAAVGSVDFAACRLGCPLVLFLGRIPYAPVVAELPFRPGVVEPSTERGTATTAKVPAVLHRLRFNRVAMGESESLLLAREEAMAINGVAAAAAPAGGRAFGAAEPVESMTVVPTPPGLDPEMQVRHCLHGNIQRVLEYSPCVRDRVADGRLRLMAAAIEVRTGDLHWLGGHPQESAIIAACNVAAARRQSSSARSSTKDAALR